MKPRKMQPRVMWALLEPNGKPHSIHESRSIARYMKLCFDVTYRASLRVVRVRVTEAP